MRIGLRITAAAVLAWIALVAGASAARAQDIEPRAFSNAPIGVNFLVLGLAHTRGGIADNPTLSLSDPELTTASAVLAYARVLDIFGMSGKFDVIVPYTFLSGSANVTGDPVERVVDGFADPRFRLSVNFFGAPALTMEQFRSYEQDLIIGGSLQVSVPVGQYDSARLVNIGTNRWSFKPELGVSKAIDDWTFEIQTGVTFFTDNDDFFGGHTRAQDPLYSIQGHVIYRFESGIWGSADATYFFGGSTTVDGVDKSDRQENWRIGATLAIPVDSRNSLKFYASNGVSARTGNNFDLYGVAWQFRWGGGL